MTAEKNHVSTREVVGRLMANLVHDRRVNEGEDKWDRESGAGVYNVTDTSFMLKSGKDSTTSSTIFHVTVTQLGHKEDDVFVPSGHHIATVPDEN